MSLLEGHTLIAQSFHQKHFLSKLCVCYFLRSSSERMGRSERFCRQNWSYHKVTHCPPLVTRRWDQNGTTQQTPPPLPSFPLSLPAPRLSCFIPADRLRTVNGLPTQEEVRRSPVLLGRRGTLQPRVGQNCCLVFASFAPPLQAMVLLFTRCSGPWSPTPGGAHSRAA